MWPCGNGGPVAVNPATDRVYVLTNCGIVYVFGDAATADLAVAKADSPDPVLVGQALTYTVRVSNNGPAEATGVALTDTLPAGVTFGSASPSQGSCSQSGDTVSCELGSLASGASATVEIVVTPTVAGPLTNTATVAGNPDDPNPANDEAEEGTTVNARACPSEIGFGETIECSIDAPGEFDEFRFTTTAARTRVLLRMSSAEGSEVDPQVRPVRPPRAAPLRQLLWDPGDGRGAVHAHRRRVAHRHRERLWRRRDRRL